MAAALSIRYCEGRLHRAHLDTAAGVRLSRAQQCSTSRGLEYFGAGLFADIAAPGTGALRSGPGRF